MTARARWWLWVAPGVHAGPLTWSDLVSSVGARQPGGRPELATRGSAPLLGASPTGLGVGRG